MNIFSRNPNRDLEKSLGYSFRRKKLLDMALTHRSCRAVKGVVADNQRLEFLGDSILGLVSGEYLYRKYQAAAEGDLTRLRIRLASGKALGKIAHDIGLGVYLKLGEGEKRTGGRLRASNLTDALEAVLGAAYLDGGLKAVGKIFKKLFIPLLEATAIDDRSDNSKGLLQELVQRNYRRNPAYRVVSQEGPAHAKTFTVEVVVNGKSMGVGKALNKQEAEKRAAASALNLLQGVRRKANANPDRVRTRAPDPSSPE